MLPRIKRAASMACLALSYAAVVIIAVATFAALVSFGLDLYFGPTSMEFAP